MTMLSEFVAGGRRVAAHRPAPRAVVDAATWHQAAQALGDERATLFGLWGERDAAHLALLDDGTGEIAVLSFACPDRRFPSVGALHPPALRLERAMRDLYGLVAEGAPDTRPWLDHGRWPNSRPEAAAPYDFRPAEGESLHRIPVGPVHAGIIEPGHFRFTAGGETVVRLEERLGYVHKGVENLMADATLERSAQLAGRVSGDSTVAYAIAFARAAEAALGVDAPPRALWLRALMAELERLANHFGDIGAICNDAAFALMHAHTGVLRERVLRAADVAFCHRLMRDGVVPGGVARDLSPEGSVAIRATVGEVRRRFPALIALYDNTASLLDRTVGAGYLRPELARQYGAGGYIGRGSGRDFDARRNLAYAPYDELRFTVPKRGDGDVNARVWIRIREVEQSLDLVDQILARLPQGATRIELPPAAGACEGLGLAEGFRGDVLVWLRLGGDGRIVRCHLRDPSWFQWPLLEAAIEGNIVADFPLCNKSFNCSYSGHDL
ncbi:MAG: NADH-quinone oxidoreductase subunit C [Alphaproteobacteria bacterium]|nr:NADH-quinone oxidoreductase subunit C [Alphaproteobacteria bacterium]